jgi:hypothetical protein
MTFSLPVIARNLNCKGNWGIVDKIGSTYNRSCPDEKLIKQIYRQKARSKRQEARGKGQEARGKRQGARGKGQEARGKRQGARGKSKE